MMYMAGIPSMLLTTTAIHTRHTPWLPTLAPWCPGHLCHSSCNVRKLLLNSFYCGPGTVLGTGSVK